MSQLITKLLSCTCKMKMFVDIVYLVIYYGGTPILVLSSAHPLVVLEVVPQLEPHSADVADELLGGVVGRVEGDHVLLQVLVSHEGGIAQRALPHRLGSLRPLTPLTWGRKGWRLSYTRPIYERLRVMYHAVIVESLNEKCALEETQESKFEPFRLSSM